MKTLFRVLALGLLLTAFSALTFAQEKTLDELFTQFKAEAKAPCGQREPALVTGKTIVEKFGTDELNKEVIDFVKKRMEAITKEDPRCKVETRYNTAYKTADKKNLSDPKWAEFLDASKQISALEGDTPLGLDILLTQVSVGFDRGATDADSVSNAKLALQRIDSGRVSKTGNWGVFEGFKTTGFPQGKENAQGWLNYIIATTMYNKMNQKKEALPYFYKVTQIVSEKQKDPSSYIAIGQYYFSDAASMYDKYLETRKANNNVDTDENKALLALSRGTADRASDAFGRALRVATDPALKTNINKTLSDLYKFRFNTATAKQADIDKYVADLNAKPMADPSTAVTPVVEEVKPTTTSTMTTTTTMTTTPVTPTTTTPKTMTTTTKSTTTATTTTTTPKTPVKKPVTKKKGTR